MADVSALEREIEEIEAELQEYEKENATHVDVIKLEGLVGYFGINKFTKFF